MGLLTRRRSIVLLIRMSVAIVSAKLSVLLGRPVWGFSLPKLQQYGFWRALHEARDEFLPSYFRWWSARDLGQAMQNYSLTRVDESRISAVLCLAQTPQSSTKGVAPAEQI